MIRPWFSSDKVCAEMQLIDTELTVIESTRIFIYTADAAVEPRLDDLIGRLTGQINGEMTFCQRYFE